MSLEGAIDEWVGVMSESSSIRSLKEVRALAKRAESICKAIKKFKAHTCRRRNIPTT